MAKKLKLFQWYDELIVAQDESDARKLLKEKQYDARTLRLYSIRQARRSVELITLSTDEVHNYTPSEVIQMHGRGVVPSDR